MYVRLLSANLSEKTKKKIPNNFGNNKTPQSWLVAGGGGDGRGVGWLFGLLKIKIFFFLFF